MDAEIIGRMPDGREVRRLTIQGGGLTAQVMCWGAVLQDLRLAGHDHPLVLGFENFADYPAHSPYFGSIVGRYANRIAGGRFSIDGQAFQADTNYIGKHVLHGGSEGFGRRLWDVQEAGADFVTLAYHAADGEMGFPGNLHASCTYALRPEGRFVVEFSAQTDAPTLCNLAHHSYFNLDDGGATDALSHLMQVDAGAYLPPDGELIPIGDVLRVDGTPFDFRALRPVRNADGAAHDPYDLNFCLSSQRGALKRAALVKGAHSGVEMEVWTTEPGLQFYDGVGTARDMPGLGGLRYGAHAGLCYEAQIWPDAPNRPYFPQALLRPGDVYAQTTEYRFKLKR